MRKILLANGPNLLQKAIDDALAGDKAMMKLCLDRLLPALKAQEPDISHCGLDSDLPLIDLNRKLSEQIRQDPLTFLQINELSEYIRLRIRLLTLEEKDDQLVNEKRWREQNRKVIDP